MMRLRYRLYPHRRYLRWLRLVARWQLRGPLPYVLKWRFARWVALLTSGPGELVTWRLPGTGLRLALDITEATQADLYYRAGPHPEVFKALARCIRPERSFVDVGANIGQETLWAADFYRRNGEGQNAMVFAFEPNPRMLSRLEHNVALNSLETIVVASDLAVSAENGKATFYLSPEDNGSASSLAATKFFGGETIDVQVVTLDSFFAERGDGRPVGLIKVDVEGAELFALQGALDLLRDDRPALILEAYPELMRTYGYSYGELHRFLRSLDYSVLIIRPGVGVIQDDDGVLPDDQPFHNLICLPRDHDGILGEKLL